MTKKTNADLPKTFTVKISGEDREIFMSYGMTHELSTLVGSPEAVPSMIVDSEMRSKVLGILLAERKPSGKVIKEVEDVDDVDISVEDYEALVEWAMESVMGFFIRALSKIADISDKHKETMTQLMSSLAGQQN